MGGDDHVGKSHQSCQHVDDDLSRMIVRAVVSTMCMAIQGLVRVTANSATGLGGVGWDIGYEETQFLGQGKIHRVEACTAPQDGLCGERKGMVVDVTPPGIPLFE